jgi:hypothetical protein
MPLMGFAQTSTGHAWRLLEQTSCDHVTGVALNIVEGLVWDGDAVGSYFSREHGLEDEAGLELVGRLGE